MPVPKVKPPSPLRLTLIVCLVEIAGLSTIATFAALLPVFQQQWGLSHAAAGWISAAYYGGYVLWVPLLSAWTDRVDARRIMGVGAVVSMLAALGYALLAQGFWSALGLRFAAGAALAGIYMPGLKVVSDHAEGPLQSRFVSFYTASFSVGAAISYLLAGEINRWAGWRWAFAASALGAALALALLVLFVPPARFSKENRRALWREFKTIVQSPPVMIYVWGYALHMWELFSLRAWVVAFLVFNMALQPPGAFVWSPTQVAFLITLLGVPSSIGGNELARIFGRRKIIALVMLISALVGITLGFMTTAPYLLVVVVALIYGMAVTGDSASLTAGAVAAAPPNLRGTTLAVHSTLGFGSAFAGPLSVGIVLDLFGGGHLAWAMGFVVMASTGLAGALMLRPRQAQ